MRKLKIAGTLALCAFAPMLMAPSGGFPSRPKFQALTVGPVPSLTLNGETPVVQIGGSASGSYFTYLQRYASGAGGPDVGLYKSRGTSAGSHTVVQVGDEVGSISFMGSTGTTTPLRYARILGTVGAVGTDGTLNLQATSVQVNGNASSTMTKHAYGTFSGGGACALDATKGNAGIASCTRNSAGSYSLTLNAGFSDEPACTVVGSSITLIPGGGATSSTGFNFSFGNTGGTLTDTPFFTVVCMGP